MDMGQVMGTMIMGTDIEHFLRPQWSGWYLWSGWYQFRC